MIPLKTKLGKLSKAELTILVTNDDGITAPGIKNLISVVRDLGKVVVVAPDSPQSGMGHAVTITQPIRLEKLDLFEGIESYQCSGTPADCVKVTEEAKALSSVDTSKLAGAVTVMSPSKSDPETVKDCEADGPPFEKRYSKPDKLVVEAETNGLPAETKV